jgi:uncharacterized protein
VFIGALRLVIQIPAARSLKDRRRVVRSFKERLRARLPVTVAEVGNAESWQVATLGVAVVSGESGVCDEILQKVIHMAQTLPEAVLADVRLEVLSFGRGGAGLASALDSKERYE